MDSTSLYLETAKTSPILLCNGTVVSTRGGGLFFWLQGWQVLGKQQVVFLEKTFGGQEGTDDASGCRERMLLWDKAFHLVNMT